MYYETDNNQSHINQNTLKQRTASQHMNQHILKQRITSQHNL